MIEIYDDLLGESYSKRISNILKSVQFPWYFQETTVYGKRDIQSMFHTFQDINDSDLEPSKFTVIPKTILEEFSKSSGHEIEKIIRMRANLVLPTPNVDVTIPHIDYEEKHHVVLYYVDAVDGNTILLNQDGSIRKEIEPKVGRFVIFDGLISHCIRVPTSSRIIFNYNVILK